MYEQGPPSGDQNQVVVAFITPDSSDVYDHEQEDTNYAKITMRQKLWGKLAATGCVLLAAGAFIHEQYFNQSGELTTYNPSIEIKPRVDGKNVILSQNMHNETSEMEDEIRNNLKGYSADIFAMQEVSFDDANWLHQKFPAWYVYFDMADAKTKSFEGGYGNVIMSKQELTDISDRVIPGNDFADEADRTIGGFFTLSPKDISDASQEDRVAFGGVIEVSTSEGKKNIRLLNLHLSGDPKIHAQQLEQAVNYVADEADKGILTIVVGDFNSSYGQVALNLTSKGFMVPKTGPTTKGSPDSPAKEIDFYGQQAITDGALNPADVEVVPTEGSDHNLLVAEALAR